MSAPEKPELGNFPLVLGGNTFGWTSDQKASFAVLDAFAAAGGAMVDTADGYSFWVKGNAGGESEAVIGAWLSERGRRDDIHVATKVSTHPEYKGLAASTIEAAAEASLRRLQTDHIDLYYAHYDDPDVPLEESIEAFEKLIAAGKVRHLGLSNFSAARAEEWMRLAAAAGATLPVVLQPHYNLLRRGPYERDYAPLAKKYELGVLPYFALAAGLLTGKYTEAAQVRGTAREPLMAGYLDDSTFAIVGTLVEVAAELNYPAAAVALAWLRTRPHVLAPVASARDAGQLDALLLAGDLQLPADVVARLNQVSEPANMSTDG